MADTTKLQAAITTCAQRLERFRSQTRRIGEQNTRVTLIEPIIEALGWDTSDPDEVHREYRRRPTDNPVDFALLLLRTPRLFIEAKGFGENLDDPRWANQTISYATVAGVEWVALTDGAQWQVYNAHALVPIEQKLFRAVNIDGDPETALDLLSLLSKENMRDNRINEEWKSCHVDRQVHNALDELFATGEPSPRLIALLDTMLDSLSHDEIRASLIRARATFDFPRTAGQPGAYPATPLAARPPSTPASSIPPPRVPASQPRQAPQRRAETRARISPEERRTHVPDLIAAGRLRPGTTLHCDYLGQHHRGELLASGEIRYNGTAYRSLSAAGQAVKQAIRGADLPKSVAATDGFEFWSAEDALVGDTVTIKEIRARTARARTSEPTP